MKLKQRLCISNAANWSCVALLSMGWILSPVLALNETNNLVQEKCEIRPLPGKLDGTLVFNSNSPEVVQTEGILLSTFPKEGMSCPEAHLNLPLKGRFDILSHHIAKGSPDNLRTLYQAIILQNPGKEKVKIHILSGASYLSQPDAPFIKLAAIEANQNGEIYSGPGDRASNDILRERLSNEFPKSINLAPGQYALLLNSAIPVKDLTPPLNGRSTLLHAEASNNIYAASLAMFASKNNQEQEQIPSLEQWQSLLKNGTLAGPRDKTPSPPGSKIIIYGRVAGVSQGSSWKAIITDKPEVPHLTAPEKGQTLAYPLSTVEKGTFATQQIQSAALIARYPDTAYQAHGNYGISYELVIPLFNNSQTTKNITLALENPLKNDTDNKNLSFYNPAPERVFFRGTVQLKYKDDFAKHHNDYFHLVSKQGEELPALIKLCLKGKETRIITVNLVYPADATPPQVLAIRTLTAD